MPAVINLPLNVQTLLFQNPLYVQTFSTVYKLYCSKTQNNTRRKLTVATLIQWRTTGVVLNLPVQTSEPNNLI